MNAVEPILESTWAVAEINNIISTRLKTYCQKPSIELATEIQYLRNTRDEIIEYGNKEVRKVSC